MKKMKLNKKLLALTAAVAGGCMSFSIAQADSSNVIVYGRLNAAFEKAKTSDSTAGVSIPSRNQVTSSVSDLLGFKGTEDLGDGLKAIWQIESNIRVDTGGTQLGTLNSHLGLSGGFGTVFYGQWDTPYKASVLPLDPFGFGGVSNASFSSVIANGATTAANVNRANFYRRQRNSVQYWTPDMSGFSGRVAYGANEERDATINPNLASLAVMYRGGPLYLSYAHERHDEYVTAGTTDTGNILGAAYTFGNTKLGFVFERLEYETAPGASTKRDAWNFSVTHKMGNNIVRASYTNADDSKGNGTGIIGAIGAPSAADDTGARQISLGYGYEMSKRTELYAQYTKITNESAARYDLSISPLGIGAGADPEVFSLGIVHRF